MAQTSPVFDAARVSLLKEQANLFAVYEALVDRREKRKLAEIMDALEWARASLLKLDRQLGSQVLQKSVEG